MAVDSECIQEMINRATDQCEYVTKYCEPNSIYNFYDLYYCQMEQSIFFIPLGIFCVYLCFYLLGSTADAYLSPILEQISKGLKFSQSLAGVTLLAFGNGAPDVFSSLSAAGSEISSTSFYLAAATSMGSGIFVSGIIASVIALMSKKEINVTPAFFIRDVVFYTISVALLLYSIVVRETIDLFMSTAFLSLYISYVIFVIVQNKVHHNRQSQANQQSMYVELQETSMPKFQFNDELMDFISRTDQSNNQDEIIAAFYEQTNSTVYKQESGNNSLETSGVVISENYIKDSGDQDISKHTPQIFMSKSSDDEIYLFQRMKIYLKKKYVKDFEKDDEEKLTFRGVMLILIEKPFNLIRNLTIPISEEDVWKRSYAAFAPPLGLVSLLIFTENLDIQSQKQQVALALSLGLSFLIRFKTYSRRAPARVLKLLQAFSFMMSVFWIWVTANFLIDLLEIFGLLTGLPPTLLALTVLAWGNSVGDFMANTSIAKKGFAEMALTGCYAAPLFNLLLGLGISTFQYNIVADNGIKFSIKDKQSTIPFILIIGNLVIMGVAFGMTVLNGYKISKLSAKINIAIYAFVILFALISSI